MDFNPDAYLAESPEKPASTDFDPDAYLGGAATAPAPALTKTQEVAPPAPRQAPDWFSLYSGLDGVDAHLDAEQQNAFGILDRNTDKPRDARARAINQAYLQEQIKGIGPMTLTQNWEAVKQQYAADKLGLDNGPISDPMLYSAIGKRMQEDEEIRRNGSLAPWTWADAAISTVGAHMRALGHFWESINTPLAKLPDPPANLPNIPWLGMENPAVVAGVYKGLKPLVEGVESPLGVATLGAGAELKVLGDTYPAAKMALVGMTGVFSALMGHAAIESGVNALPVIRDPGASLQDKIAAVTEPVATGAAAVLGAFGTALEAMPRERVPPFLIATEGRTPAEVAQAFRQEIKEALPGDKPAIEAAATELEKLPEGPRGVTSEGDNADVLPDTPDSAAKPPAETPRIIANKGDPISIKNATMDAELASMGLKAAERGKSLSDDVALEDALGKMKDTPHAGEVLVNELAENPRPPTGKEDALLVLEVNRRRLARDAAEQELIDAVRNGDPDGESTAKFNIAAARDSFNKSADVFAKAGTESSHSLRFRAMMVKEDYSLAAMERRRGVANNGQPLTDAQVAEVKTLHDKLTAAEKALADYRTAETTRVPDTSPQPRAAPPARNRIAAALTEQANAARERIKARLTSGRVSSGIDPTDLADYAVIGADYLARGVTKFGEWSAGMVREFGQTIVPHLQAIFDKANEAHTEARRLAAYKTRASGRIEDLEEKLASGDFTKKQRKPLSLDKEALRLTADVERVKKLVTLAEMRDNLKNRTPQQKVSDAFLKWVRFGALSWPTVLGKLTGAAIIRTVTTPMEQAVGFGLSKLMPELAAKAPREGVPELSGAMRAEAKAITEGLMMGIKGSWDLLRNRETDLSAIMEKTHLPPEITEYLGKLHQALKNPTKMNEYARSLEVRVQHARRNGIDPTDEIQQMRLMHEAYMDANRSIFMQDNKVVDAYKQGLAALVRRDKATGKSSAALEFLATAIQAEMPIVKVPTNVIAEASTILTGWLTGPAKAAFAYAGGIEKLKPAEADAIMRLMKKGSIGLALTALGFFKATEVGGFYQPGEKRSSEDVKPGDIKVGDATVPAMLTHNPYITALDFGSTMRRAADSRFKKSDLEPKGMASGLLAASLGLIEETPFVRETSTVGKYLDPRTSEGALAAKGASILIPGTVQWIAAQLDKERPFDPSEAPRTRKPTGLLESIKKDIPGLRQEVPEKKRKAGVSNIERDPETGRIVSASFANDNRVAKLDRVERGPDGKIKSAAVNVTELPTEGQRRTISISQLDRDEKTGRIKSASLEVA